MDSDDEDADIDLDNLDNEHKSESIGLLYNEIENETSESTICKLILKLKTSPDGYWKVNECCDSNRELCHNPPLVKSTSYFKKLREKQRNINY